MNPEYAQRIDRVIDYLRENLHRPVKLAELAAVACFSEFHFHRIFGAVSGETVNSFTHRLRLEKAGWNDLDALIAQLEKSGVKILQGPESHKNGKFAWLMDPDGNKVALWEPKTS